MLKLFTVLIEDCLNIKISATDLNVDEIYHQVIDCLKIMSYEKTLHSTESIKKSIFTKKSSEFLILVFKNYSNLFFLSSENVKYFIFLEEIFLKMSLSDITSLRFLAINFSLKIITGMLQFECGVMLNNQISKFLDEFVTKKFNDVSYIIREALLIELEKWIKINPTYFINKYWTSIYITTGDKSLCVQKVALQICKSILAFHSSNPNIHLLADKLLQVLINLLLSKNEEIALLAYNMYEILQNCDTNDEHLSKLESIALELIFSENVNIARHAAQHFVINYVNKQTNSIDRLKFISVFLSGIPENVPPIVIAYFANAIFEFCAELQNFQLFAEILDNENHLNENEKCIMTTLFVYIVRKLITGNDPEQNSCYIGYTKDVKESKPDNEKKKEFTTVMLPCILNQLKNCKKPTYEFSLWALMQYIDYTCNLSILHDVLLQVGSSFFKWTIPGLLELISRSIYLMTLSLKGQEYNLVINNLKNSTYRIIDVLKSGIENSQDDMLTSISCQEISLIRLWSLAKYNKLPEEINLLEYLSYYIPEMKDSQNNLVFSMFGFYAYFEILKRNMINEIDFSLENCIDHQCLQFMESMFSVLKSFDKQLFELNETSFLIIGNCLQVRKSINKPFDINTNQDLALSMFIYYVCENHELNGDINTVKLIELFFRLIQERLIKIRHMVTVMQFIQKDIFEKALGPVFNFFCNAETGNELCQVIEIFLIYMFENIICQSENYENITFKDLVIMASKISQLINQCTDTTGKRLVSTNVLRHGIQYALNDTLEYPFKQFFWVLASLCNSLTSYDAEKLADYFIENPYIKEMIDIGEKHVLTFLYKLREKFSEDDSSSDKTC
ncbi:uncharacterized protein LOC126899101 isoform X2 [Daktulosphaira vitifoliae]|nr:uncharacterized protein LOC126899101 isoform X2 [Daktulosphaira vitifoliae]